jgi:hypothetical protein
LPSLGEREKCFYRVERQRSTVGRAGRLGCGERAKRAGFAVRRCNPGKGPESESIAGKPVGSLIEAGSNRGKPWNPRPAGRGACQLDATRREQAVQQDHARIVVGASDPLRRLGRGRRNRPCRLRLRADAHHGVGDGALDRRRPDGDALGGRRQSGTQKNRLSNRGGRVQPSTWNSLRPARAVPVAPSDPALGAAANARVAATRSSLRLPSGALRNSAEQNAFCLHVRALGVDRR